MVDVSRQDYKPLMEQEVNGLTYRYVNSDKARLSVVVQGIENGSSSLLDSRGELHAYYHTDYLGTTDYLTSAVNSKVIAWTSYNEWGEITHNAVLKCGQRELDLVKEYATHDYDAVLDLYYAKARFYDAYNRTFTAQDPILDPSQYDLREYVKEPMALVQYLYVKANTLNRVDPLGLKEVKLRTITEEYGGKLTYISPDKPFVTFGSRGGKVYGNESIAYKKKDGQFYVDDETFLEEWGIQDKISVYSEMVDGTVRFVIFKRLDQYNRAEYFERMTVCSKEVKYEKVFDSTYTHWGARDTIEIQKISYDEYDYFSGGAWSNFTNAISDIGHPFISFALGFIDVSKDVSLDDIRIAKKQRGALSHYYYINDDMRLVAETNLGELLFF